ncbi:MAG TPA: GTPase ObgE, partial [Candidatus Moranbacteria bacterium]|nr:GTPase ObgE [Candidatus Moranbacteria bacterium]
MIVDEVTIKVRGGRGGDGLAAFSRQKMSRGPTGGDGGRGGDVVLRAVADLGALKNLRTRAEVAAAGGERGGQNTRTGADGADWEIAVPVGTAVYDLSAERSLGELLAIGEKKIVARGGAGGRGNFFFRSARRTSPRQATAGSPGEEKLLRLELKMIADIGLVGLPNVGKSALLNHLTGARSKVGNYKFTTLEPHLGVYYELVLADIPGLIAGAAAGRGLGGKFLRHIERTKVLFHLVSADSADHRADYRLIREELAAYNPALARKPEYVILSRTDKVSPERVEISLRSLRDTGGRVLPVSVVNGDGLPAL